MTDDRALCVLEGDDDQPAEATHGLLCRSHRRRLDYDTHEIGRLIVDTRNIRDGGAPQDAGPRGKHAKRRADPPPPGDIQIMTLFDPRTRRGRLPGTPTNPAGDQSEPQLPILAMIAGWVTTVADERPLTTPLPKTVLAQLDLLRRHHDWIAEQEFVDDYALELTEIRRALVAAVHDRPYTRVGYCDLPTDDHDKCGGALTAENGTSVIRCARCKAQWVTPQEVARLSVRLN